MGRQMGFPDTQQVKKQNKQAQAMTEAKEEAQRVEARQAPKLLSAEPALMNRSVNAKVGLHTRLECRRKDKKYV